MLVGYIRQIPFDQDYERQRDALNKMGLSKNQLYIEAHHRTDVQGKILKKLLLSLSSGDKLIVYRLASLARSLQGLNKLFNELQQRGIAVQSIQEGIDTSQADCEAFLQYFNAITTFTEDLKREKIMKGIAASSHKGGRPPALNDHEVKEVVKLLKNGKPISEIARKFKAPRTTIYRIRDRHL